MRWLIVCALAALGADGPKNNQQLLDRSGAFAYALPSYWQVQHRDQFDHDYILFTASDGLNRNIVINDQPGSETLEALKQEYERELPRVVEDFHLVSSELVEVEGKGKVVRIIETNTAPGFPVRQLCYIIVLDTKRYFIACSVPLNDGDKHDREFEAFISSMSKPKISPSLLPSEKVAPIVATEAAFSEPPGWIRLKPDKAKTKGWFISPDSDPKSPESMILIDIGKPVAGSARAMAEDTARQWGGRVLEEKTVLDGVEAVRVRVDNPGQGLRPVEGVIAIRNGHAYMLMGGAVPGKKVVDQVEEVRKHWKWVK